MHVLLHCHALSYNVASQLNTNVSDSPVLRTLWAAENGELNIAKEMIDGNSELLHCQDSDGYTPLHRASYNGHVHVIQVR